MHMLAQADEVIFDSTALGHLGGKNHQCNTNPTFHSLSNRARNRLFFFHRQGLATVFRGVLTSKIPEEVVHSFAAAAPVVVVIEDNTSSSDQMRVDSFEANLHGIVPIHIDVGEGHCLADLKGVLDEALNQRDRVFMGVNAMAAEIALDLRAQIPAVSIIGLARPRALPDLMVP